MFKIPIQENTSILLPEIVIGRASAFEGVLMNVPADYDNVQIAFEQANGASVPCPCNARPGGEWGIYANGAFFLSLITKGAYHVTARTHKGDSVYLGSGTLRVKASILNVDANAVPVLPQDVYVRGGNGLYYKVTAELDEDGVPYMVVDQNGVTM